MVIHDNAALLSERISYRCYSLSLYNGQRNRLSLLGSAYMNIKFCARDDGET